MNDLDSQISQIRVDGGLKVDVTPLESILLGITRALKNHDVIFSKLPEIEGVHSGLRRDLNKLKVALESTVSRVSHEESSADFARRDEIIASAEETAPSSSYGLKKDIIDPIQRRRSEQFSKDNNALIITGLNDVKAKIRQLQQDHGEMLTNSLGLDENLKTVKDDLLKVQQKLAVAASTAQLQMLQKSVAANHGQMEAHLNDFLTGFRDEVHHSINDYLAGVKSSFTALEVYLKQRQDKMDVMLLSCAKEYDIAAFRDSVESEIASLVSKTSFLDDTANAQGKALVVIQQKNALVMCHRRYSEWRRNTLKMGVSRWKRAVQCEVKYERDKISQKRLIKKVLTSIMSRRRSFGFDKWIRYRNWHRETERLKINASSLVCERLQYYLTASKTEAFYKWRRMTVLHKIKFVVSDADDGGVSVEGSQHSDAIDAPSQDSNQRQYNLNSIIDSLKNDPYGASIALGQELDNIKMQDIAILRREMNDGQQQIISSTTKMIKDAIERMDHAAEVFKQSITERVDSCHSQFPPIYSQLKELSNLFKSHKTHLKNIEESSRTRLDMLFDQSSSLDKRLTLVEELAKATSVQAASMSEEQSKSNHNIQRLSEMILSNEASRDQESKTLRELMDRFGDELLKTKVTLGHTQVRCESLENELLSTKQELAHVQEVSQAENQKISDAMKRPGIQRINLERIVRVGHAYESLAKEKNYVTGINTMVTMTSEAGPSMKSNREKLRFEEQVDVPAEIAAFAHDYAEWIAYQADHESLLRLVTGTNPDEQVYAEDDIITRRKKLLEDLKSNLSSELERVSYPRVVDLPDATTRGLGLRWEARAIFLARVVDASRTALSKHDHLSLPSQTRLGRSRPASANITVCVACDRPMRKKNSKSRQTSVKETEDTARPSAKSVQSMLGK